MLSQQVYNFYITRQQVINSHSIDATSDLHFNADGRLLRPAYGSYCFAHIPDTIRAAFGAAPSAVGGLPQQALPDGGQGFERVLFFFIDGLGWELFERHAGQHPLLQELLRGGVVSRMTSMFPSTTSAHVTCMNSGLPVGASGVYEWFYYEPLLDMVIQPLMFSPAGERGRDLLLQQNVKAASLFPEETLYLDLKPAGVKSYQLTSQEYARSAYSEHFGRGAEILPFVTFGDGLAQLERVLEKRSGRLYAYVYMAGVDAVEHQRGPLSRNVEYEVLGALDQLERFLRWLRASGAGRRTLLLLTADHGLAPTNPSTTLYLNQAFPGIEASFRQTRQGKPVLFGGSPRDLFLYIQDERLEETHARLAQALAGRAEVHRTADLLAQGLFGQQPVSERLKERLGNLVILPYAGESVGWYEKDRFEMKYFGHHGGLSPQEMLIPFAAYPVEQ